MLEASLFDFESSTKAADFSSVYSNQELSEKLNKLELLYKVKNEEDRFEALVNMSTSGNKPYYRWAKYREGYSGELVKELIRRSGVDSKKQFVYDPMSGSGSTITAGLEEGFDALGNDVSPYAVDVTQAKITCCSEAVLQEVQQFITAPLDQECIRAWKDLSALKIYFQTEHLAVIQQIANKIHSLENEDARKLLFVAWLMSLEDASERKKDGNGLATRPSPIHDIWARFVLQIKMMLSDLREYPLPRFPKRKIALQSAMSSAELVYEFAKETGKELGAIIFSPPYANSFDYFESYKLELLGGYYTPDELIRARETTIRSYRKGYRYQLQTDLALVEMLCQEVRCRIPEKEKEIGKLDNRSRLVPNLLIGYFEDMKIVLQGLAKAAPPGSYCHIVVDQSSYLGVIIPTDIVLATIGEMFGFEVQEIIRCRSARTSPQQLTRYPYLKYMLRESIVSLRKL